MVVRCKLSALKEGRWYEYVIRFVLGGAATVIAGVIANTFGPETGGLFLAFPAIFYASATLIEKHEREQKQEKGMRGELRGKDAAALDAVGAGWGSLGMAAFAVTIWAAAPAGMAVVLPIASFLWLLCACGAWLLRRNLPPARTS
jgi:hypothetical protein